MFPAVHSNSSHLMLEEVDSGDTQNPDQEKRSEQLCSQKQAEPEQLSDPEAVSPSGSCLNQEDAETQTGRWTPFIESIKREAEDNAMATIEERSVSHFGGYKIFNCLLALYSLRPAT